MEKSKPVVVGIGELLWDVFPEVKKAGGAYSSYRRKADIDLSWTYI